MLLLDADNDPISVTRIIANAVYTKYGLDKPVILVNGPAARIKQKATKMINKGILVLWLASIFSSLVTLGKLDTQKKIATAMYKPARIKYKLFTAYNVRNEQDMETLFKVLPS